MQGRVLSVLLVLVGCGAVVMASASQAATPPTLRAAVGVDERFTINLRKASGTRVTTLRAGTYVIRVNDASRRHNFRLRGPGIDRTTTVTEIATRSWTVRLRPGTYTYVCKPHPFAMSGTFRVT